MDLTQSAVTFSGSGPWCYACIAYGNAHQRSWWERQGFDSEAAVVACWLLVLARFSHLDEITFGLARGRVDSVQHGRAKVSSDETPAGLIAQIGVALANRDDALTSGGVQCVILLCGKETLEAPFLPKHDGAIVCALRINGGACTEVLVGYDARRNDSTWVAALLRHFSQLLDRFPEVETLGQVDWLNGSQRECVLYEWNSTAKDYPFEECLHWLFEKQAARTPKAVAVEFEGEPLTYEELDTRASRVAGYLSQLGVGCGSLVPFCAERSNDLVVGLLAILKTGAAYVPVDPRFPSAHTRQVLEDCEPRLILAQRRFIERLPTIMATVVPLEGCINGDPAMPHAGHPREIACVMYTSGSTGTPKGTLIDHRSLVNNILWLQDYWPLTADDRLLQKTPFTFDVSIKEILWPLSFGARIVLARPQGHIDMGYLAQLIAQREVTVTHFVPSMLQRFLDLPGSRLCRSLKLVMCGAEILAPRLKQRFFEQLHAKLLHLYGPTEAAISVIGWECRRGIESGVVVPLGRPMANVQIYILDAAGKAVPPGVPGEIHIGGVAVARGYLKRPELSQERFVEDRFGRQKQGALLYRTGDLARFREDGIIEFIGRIDQQVKIRGARVEPREIEMLLSTHPRLKRVAVRAQRDRLDEMRLIAYAVAEGESPPSAWCLRNYCADSLPSFMVPAAFVILDEMPLLPNGKIDYSSLPGLESR